MYKYILMFLILMCTPISAYTFTENPTVLLDKEFSPGGEFSGIGERVIESLNKDLGNIQLDIKYSEHDYGLHAFYYNYEGNGTTADIIREYGKAEDEYIINARNEIRVMIDNGQSGFSGGTHVYCEGTPYQFDDLCTSGPNLVGRVSLSKFRFKELAEPQLSWESDKYGPTYLQEDIVTHELTHTINGDHIMGPYMVEDTLFDHTGTPNFFAALVEPNMDPSRSSWTYGRTYADQMYTYQQYGIPEDVGPLYKVDVNLLSNRVYARGLNVAFIPARKHTKWQLRRNFKKFTKKDLNLAKTKAAARSFHDNYTSLLLKRGFYYVKVRNIARIKSISSQVEGENRYDPYFEGEQWVCEKNRGLLGLCDDPKYAKLIKIRRDRTLYVKLEN